MNNNFADSDMFPAQKKQTNKKLKRAFQPVWFSLFSPIMKAEDDGERACRQQLFDEFPLVLKYRIRPPF